MASSIFFNGRVIYTPGSYSQVDTSGLEQVGLGATGIVAVIGQAVGGMPYTAISQLTDYIRLNQPSDGAKNFQSGDLLDVTNMLFAPSNDANIPGGAQQVVAMKVNPATQSTASLGNTHGDALDITSADWGAFTTQINVSIASGSTQGKMLTIVYEDTVETVDNLGGTATVQLSYNGGTNGYTSMTTGIAAGGSVHANGQLAHAGMSSDITAQPASAYPLVATATATDAGKTLTLYGLSSNVLTKETLTLVNGTATSVNAYTAVYGYVLSAPAGATITVTANAVTQVTFAATAQYKGFFPVTYGYVANTTVTVQASGASTAAVIIEGLSATGALQRESITLNGTTPVTSAGSYSLITGMGLGVIGSGLTITLAAKAAQSSALVQQNLTQLASYFNAKQTAAGGTTYGFDFTIVTTATQQPVTQLDATYADQSCYYPTVLSLYANLYAIVNWINSNSQLITAVANANAAGGPPSNTSNPVFLVGGSEGTPTFTDYQNCLNLLKQVRVNTVVALTCDPAVTAAVDAHCTYMCGVGRSERDAFAGMQNSGMTDVPTLAQLTAQIQAINSRNIRACAQAVTLYNAAGVSTEFQPHFLAALGAGMQAGAAIGTSLTHKYVNVLSFRQDTSWNPTDDSDQLIQSGLFFLEQVDGIGIRVVRNITTYLQAQNVAYTEGSVNAAVNYAVYTFRNAMETAVGQPGFAGTINAVKGLAITQLGLLVDANVITAWRALSITLNVDVLEINVQIAPIIPINFVASTIHLITVPQSGTTSAAA